MPGVLEGEGVSSVDGDGVRTGAGSCGTGVEATERTGLEARAGTSLETVRREGVSARLGCEACKSGDDSPMMKRVSAGSSTVSEPPPEPRYCERGKTAVSPPDFLANMGAVALGSVESEVTRKMRSKSVGLRWSRAMMRWLMPRGPMSASAGSTGVRRSDVTGLLGGADRSVPAGVVEVKVPIIRVMTRVRWRDADGVGKGTSALCLWLGSWLGVRALIEAVW